MDVLKMATAPQEMTLQYTLAISHLRRQLWAVILSGNLGGHVDWW